MNGRRAKLIRAEAESHCKRAGIARDDEAYYQTKSGSLVRDRARQAYQYLKRTWARLPRPERRPIPMPAATRSARLEACAS